MFSIDAIAAEGKAKTVLRKLSETLWNTPYYNSQNDGDSTCHWPNIQLLQIDRMLDVLLLVKSFDQD